MLGSRGAARRSDRGAVAVEAALVLPVLIAVLFGIVEFSFLMRDNVAVTSSVRGGARVAASLPGAGPGTCATGSDVTCTPAKAPALAQAAADAIQQSGSAMPADQIQYLMVFKANAQGYPGTDGLTTMPSSCPANCVKFVWRPAAGKFRYDSGDWDSASINACVNESDSVGVYLSARHQSLTGIIPTVGVGDRTVMKFEPLPSESCKPGTVSPHS